MLTKEFIETRKLERNDKFFAEVLGPTSDEQKLLFVLEKLGKLPRDFDGSVFLRLLQHPNAKIRLLAVKNLGKLKAVSWLGAVKEFKATCKKPWTESSQSHSPMMFNVL